MYFVMKPRGYGKCYKEYKEVIDYYEKEIARLNKIIDELKNYILNNMLDYSQARKDLLEIINDK